jgi:hypothetical protein
LFQTEGTPLPLIRIFFIVLPLIKFKIYLSFADDKYRTGSVAALPVYFICRPHSFFVYPTERLSHRLVELLLQG